MTSVDRERALGAGAHKWAIEIDGCRLREARRRRGLSQEALADLARVSVTTVVRLERRQSLSCRAWTLGRLAVALGEEPTALMTAKGQ